MAAIVVLGSLKNAASRRWESVAKVGEAVVDVTDCRGASLSDFVPVATGDPPTASRPTIPLENMMNFMTYFALFARSHTA
jgi:hypothetical protein